MIELKLPTWFNNNEIVRLKNALTAFWLSVEQLIKWPLTQQDADTCTEKVLAILAWGRDIDRFNDEPLWLYRKRVKFAKVNAQDAGSGIGIKRIFERLGVGFVEVVERDHDKDWDVITLRLSDDQVSQNTTLLQVMVKMYGRTCRRYEFETITTINANIRTIDLFADYQCY